MSGAARNTARAWDDWEAVSDSTPSSPPAAPSPSEFPSLSAASAAAPRILARPSPSPTPLTLANLTLWDRAQSHPNPQSVLLPPPGPSLPTFTPQILRRPTPAGGDGGKDGGRAKGAAMTPEEVERGLRERERRYKEARDRIMGTPAPGEGDGERGNTEGGKGSGDRAKSRARQSPAGSLPRIASSAPGSRPSSRGGGGGGANGTGKAGGGNMREPRGPDGTGAGFAASRGGRRRGRGRGGGNGDGGGDGRGGGKREAREVRDGPPHLAVLGRREVD